MPKYKFLVMTDPVEGREDEYNQWYNESHLDDLVRIPGIVAAQRFRLAHVAAGTVANSYLAIYEVECDDPADCMAAMAEHGRTGAMSISGALRMDNQTLAFFEECSPRVVSPG
jgi:hypothetical protein